MPVSDELRYVLPKKLAGNRIAYYWSPTDKALADSGMERQRLGSDYATAHEKAKELNHRLDFWKVNRRFPDEPDASGPLPGTIDAVFARYQELNPSKPGAFKKLKPKQQKDYQRLMRRFANHKLKTGRRLGDMPANRLDARTADAVYEKLLYDTDGNARRRVTNHTIAICRKAFNVVARSNPEWMPVKNPFDGMTLDTSSAETTPATYADLVAFEKKAAEMDLPEMAFAARAAWELLQRVEEICTTFAWTHWRPLDNPDAVFLGFAKNKNPVWKPLGERGEKGRWIAYYPELEELLAAVPRRGALVMVHNATKGRKKADGSSVKAVFRPYTTRFMQKRARLIRDAAELPPHVTMETFRHGGLTELGSAGLPDTLAQALSRHKQRATLDRYIHTDVDQMKKGARLRLAHRRGET